MSNGATNTVNYSNPFVNSTSTARIQRFGRGSTILRARVGQTLDDSQIMAAAPSIFAMEKHASRSERYSYIPTSEVLAGLRKEGFQPVEVRQGGSGDEAKRNFTKHLMRFRHESAMGVQVGGHFREIVMINAHDGTSSYQLMAGIFRLVCSNGMVVGEGTIDQVRVKHTGNVIPEVIEGCNAILQRLPEVSENVREMESLQLTEGERGVFAKAALELRYQAADAPIEAPQLLTLKRTEDARPSLWNTLNTVQENMIRGGVRYDEYREGSRRPIRRQTREVRGIDQNTGLNRALWTLAEEMKKLKA